MNLGKFSLAIIGVSVLIFYGCKKGSDASKKPSPAADCYNVVNTYGTDSSDIIVPTAFSPNGDGENDLYRPIIPYASKIKSFSVTVYNADGTIAYQANNTSGWDGMNATGAKNLGYRFNVSISFTTASGRTVDTCTYIYLLRNSGAGCLNDVAADKTNYIFGDQIDPLTGKASYPTNEILCN